MVQQDNIIRITVSLPRDMWEWLRKQTYLGDARSVSETVRKIIAAAMVAEEEKGNVRHNLDKKRPI